MSWSCDRLDCLLSLDVSGSSHDYMQMNGPRQSSHSGYATHSGAIWPQWGGHTSSDTGMQGVLSPFQHSQQSVGQMSTHSRLIQATGNQVQKELTEVFGLLDSATPEFSDLSGMFNSFSWSCEFCALFCTFSSIVRPIQAFLVSL